MTIYIGIGTSSNKAAPKVTIGIAGVNKTVTAGYIGTAAGNKQFFPGTSPPPPPPPPTVSVSPQNSSYNTSAGTGSYAIGESASYSGTTTPTGWTWGKQSGSSQFTVASFSNTASKSSSATINFNRSGAVSGQSYSASFYAQSAGSGAATGACSITVTVS